MDRGLQERVVGAAVLVALGVWLIPWVLDGSAVNGDVAEADTAIKLPAPENPDGRIIRRQTIDLSAGRGALVKSPDTDAQPATESVAATQVARSADSAPDPAPAPEPAAQPQPVERTVEQTPPAAPEILSVSQVAGWMVQLGSFSDAGNARRQAQRIGTYGHDARIYEFAAVGGRTMFRVRLGPIDSRESAEATASSLSAHGFVAQVIAPERLP